MRFDASASRDPSIALGAALVTIAFQSPFRGPNSKNLLISSDRLASDDRCMFPNTWSHGIPMSATIWPSVALQRSRQPGGARRRVR